MNTIRIISLILGVVFIVLFIPPLVMYRILNLGNATGLLTGIILIVYGAFSKSVNLCISLLWRSISGRIILSFVCVVLFLCFLLAMIISALLFKAAREKPDGDETLVVLGCQVKGTNPSLMLTERLNAAKAYLDDHEGAYCILSGGQGPDEEISEAQCMYNYLKNQGISSDRLIMEDRSTSTRENLYYSLKIIEKNDLNKNIAIVTNEFHEYRAFKIGEKLNIKTSAVPAKTHWWLFPTYFVREWYGVIYEWTGMEH